MSKALKIVHQQSRKLVFRALILLAAFTVVSDSFALVGIETEGPCAHVYDTDTDTAGASEETRDCDSKEDIPCSSGDHCHQHHCQTLFGESASVALFHSISYWAIEEEHVPSSPFLDRVPRPPAI